MTTKKELAKNQDLAVTERPDWLPQESTRGSEEVTNSDVALPRLQIVQDLSPQHKKNKDEYIDGAEVGMVFNTVTQELYPNGLMIVPVYYKFEHIIWKDQGAGGGFFGAFATEQEAVQELKKVIQEDGGKPDDYEIVGTNVHFVLIVDESSTADDPVVEQAVISMAKSQNKVSRNFNSMIRMAGGDRFSKIYSLSTKTDKNKAGQEYMNWAVKPKSWVSKALYEIGETAYEAIKSGERKVDYGSGAEKQEAPVEGQKDGDFDDEFAV
jgi:hypothetical protein